MIGVLLNLTKDFKFEGWEYSLVNLSLNIENIIIFCRKILLDPSEIYKNSLVMKVLDYVIIKEMIDQKQ